MPNMNGFEAGKELRRLYGDTFKMYLVTGNVLSAEEEQIKSIFDRVILKPFSKDVLQSCLEMGFKNK